MTSSTCKYCNGAGHWGRATDYERCWYCNGKGYRLDIYANEAPSVPEGRGQSSPEPEGALRADGGEGTILCIWFAAD